MLNLRTDHLKRNTLRGEFIRDVVNEYDGRKEVWHDKQSRVHIRELAANDSIRHLSLLHGVRLLVNRFVKKMREVITPRRVRSLLLRGANEGGQNTHQQLLRYIQHVFQPIRRTYPVSTSSILVYKDPPRLNTFAL